MRNKCGHLKCLWDRASKALKISSTSIPTPISIEVEIQVQDQNVSNPPSNKLLLHPRSKTYHERMNPSRQAPIRIPLSLSPPPPITRARWPTVPPPMEHRSYLNMFHLFNKKKTTSYNIHYVRNSQNKHPSAQIDTDSP